jgi:hypothetical protein
MKAFIAICVPFFLSACSAERMALVKDRAETGRLSESAEMYWHAMRWGDHPAAAAFIEDPDARFAWMERVTEVQGRHYRSAEVLSVTAGPLMDAMPSQVLKADMVKQEWYRAAGGWYLSAEDAR